MLAAALPGASARRSVRHAFRTISAISDKASNSGPRDRNADVEDFGDHLQPAMQEIGPAVLHLQRAARRLGAGLIEENEIAAII